VNIGTNDKLDTFPDPRASRKAARSLGGFDDATLERKINEGFRPKHWLHADDLLPPTMLIPKSVTGPQNRDWDYLLEVWTAKPESEERDKMIALCRKKIALKNKQPVAAQP